MSFTQQAFDSSLPFWGSEFAIAVEYFRAGSPYRSRAQDLKWLRTQIWKEWHGSGVYGPSGETVRSLIASASRTLESSSPSLAELQQASHTLDFAADELAHFVALVDVYQKLSETPDAWPLDTTPAGDLLTEQRYALRESQEGSIAVRLSEGGGLGLFFGMQHAFESNPHLSREDRLLDGAVRRILSDEVGHLTSNFRWAATQLSDHVSGDAIVQQLAEISKSKLKEREDQFAITTKGLEADGIDISAHIAQYQEHHLNDLLAQSVV